MLTPFARPREQHSLFGEILDWLLAPLLVLWPLSIASIWLVAQGIANGPFDRELSEKVRVLSKHVSVTTTPSGVTLAQFTLPPSASELLRTDEADDVYYQVLDLRGAFDQQHRAVVHHDRAFGELQASGDLANLHALVSLSMTLPLTM